MPQNSSRYASRSEKSKLPNTSSTSSNSASTSDPSSSMSMRLPPKSNLDSPSRVAVKERDYLEEDAPIRGQEYCCVSFVSPEDEIQSKEIFTLFEFTKNLSKDVDGLLTHLNTKFEEINDMGGKEMVRALRERHDYLYDNKALEDQFKYFKMKHNVRLEKEYSEKNDFRTNIRGVKVRGSYATLEEAKNRATFLEKMYPRTPAIYVGQVGCWCPWSPYPEEVEDVEYSSTDLNTLMKKYKENELERDRHYEERKQMLLEGIDEERKKINKEKESEKESEKEEEQEQKQKVEDDGQKEKDDNDVEEARKEVDKVDTANVEGVEGVEGSKETV